MSRQIRHSILAGQWYPGTARELKRTIGSFFANVEPAGLDGQVVGLICPHAGYAYSGQTAAYAYSQVRGESFDVVVVISPLHRLPLGRFAVNSATLYETPLGLVRVAQDLVDALDREVGINRVAQDGEHSVEIQLPFLQVALDDINLLPVMVGESSFEAGTRLGRALAGMLEGKKALIVASSDMHHIDNYAEVVRRDQVVIEAIDSFDMARIQKALSPWDCSVCGRIPIYAMLTAAQSLSADQVKILHHTTSGDVTGMRTPGQYTVGYLAAAAYRQQ
jgi:AmmeMemoRadiSam system protein B